jgi:hypothetical protein
MADLAWGAELAAVIAVRPHGPAAVTGPIEGSGSADHQSPHARRQSGLVVRLGDEV